MFSRASENTELLRKEKTEGESGSRRFYETDKTHLVDIFSLGADALRQYLEQLALEGWYPESIGTIGMKCRLGEPEKRRYAAVLAPKTSVLTGVDSWDAGKFRERCEAAGWKLQYSGTNWQIF